MEARPRPVPAFIVTDSQAALQAITRGNRVTQAGALIRDIATSLRTLSERSSKPLRLVWTQAHQGMHGNEATNAAARETTTETRRPSPDLSERIRELGGVLRSLCQDRTENPAPKYGTRGHST